MVTQAQESGQGSRHEEEEEEGEEKRGRVWYENERERVKRGLGTRRTYSYAMVCREVFLFDRMTLLSGTGKVNR